MAGRGKEKVVAGVLGILLGGFGAHHFYLGSMGSGFILLGVSLLSLITCVLAPLAFVPWVAGLIEGIMILVMPDAEFNQRYNDRTPESVEFVFMKPKTGGAPPPPPTA
jgi:TM2 domain-containing membrane protein YozV